MNKEHEKVPRWTWKIAWLLLIVGILVVASTAFPRSFPSLGAGWFTKTTTSQVKPPQDPCSYRYASASMKRITVVLPANGEWSEKVALTGQAGKCYYFEGPEGSEVRFGDGTRGSIAGKHYGAKIPLFQFSNPVGGTVTIAIEQ